jgi:long-chain fatty acid transport protein
MNVTLNWRTARAFTFALTLLGTALTGPPTLWGLGFRIPNQDAEATGRGNAFAATADNPSAIYYNPAGIIQTEGSIAQLGAHLISVNSEYRSPAGLRAETEFEVLPVPQFYYAHRPKGSRFAYGVGMYAPFGMGLEWPSDNPFRTLAIEGRLTYVTLSPVVAWQALRHFTIAAGPTVNYSKTKLRQGLGFTPNDELIFKGDDYAFGATAGVLWQPHPQWSLGASYFTPTAMEYEGTTRTHTIPALTGSARTSGTIDFPQFAKGGISFRPTKKWNLEADIDWTDWDALNSVTFNGTRNLFGQDLVLPFFWESSFLYELGVTRSFANGMFVSGGYFFSQNSTSERYFNPAVPDTDLHVGSLGFGYKGKHWRWALSGQIITGPAREIDSSLPSAAGQSANGKYQWFNQAVNISVAYNF